MGRFVRGSTPSAPPSNPETSGQENSPDNLDLHSTPETASLDMMTGSATTEELYHSATPSPRPSPHPPAQGSPPPSPSHLLPLPSTPLLSCRRSPSLRVCGQGMEKPVSSSGSPAIALVADAAIDGDSVNSNSAGI